MEQQADAKPTISLDFESPEHAREWEAKAGELRAQCPFAWATDHGGHWIASRYKDLVEDETLRETIFGRLRAEWEASHATLLAILDQRAPLERNPMLARSIRNRFPYIDPLNHVQIELLRRHRDGDTDPGVVQGIHLSINGIAAGLRNSG